MQSLFMAAFGAAFVGMALCSPAPAHEGHVHAEQAAPTSAPSPSRSARADVASDTFELVAVVRGQELLLYLDRFATNEPAEGAVIEAETPAGPLTASAEPGKPYRLSGSWLAKPGQVDLIFTVTAGDVTEILPLSLMLPEATPMGVEEAGPATAGPGSDGMRPLLIVAGVALLSFVLGLVFASRARPKTGQALLLTACISLVAAIPDAYAHEGHDHGPPTPAPASPPPGEVAQRLANGAIFVPKPAQRICAIRTVRTEENTHRRTIELPGRVIPDPNASGLVQAAVGGRLSPPVGGFPPLGAAVAEGAVLAYVTPPLQAIDVSDMRQRQGELDQQIAIVQRRLVRFETLAPAQAVSKAQLEETRLELEGLKDRRAALDRISHNPEPLVAPVSGVVADANAVPGQMAQPDSVVFQIVDPARLWVEALSFERIAGSPDASARSPAGDTIALSYRGAGYADRNQAVPIHFAIDAPASGLRPGQFVTVLVATEAQKQGIAVPRSALVRGGSGQTAVFEHTGAELFEARTVRTEPLDGERVLVTSGLTAGQRIVTQGAELLDQVR